MENNGIQSNNGYACSTGFVNRPVYGHPSYQREYHQGQVYYIHRYPNYGAEIDPKKGRPAVIISRDEDIRRYNHVMVAYFSSTGRDDQPTQSYAKIGVVQGWTRCEQIDSVDKTLVGDLVGHFPVEAADDLYRCTVIAVGCEKYVKGEIEKARREGYESAKKVATKQEDSSSKTLSGDELKAWRGEFDLTEEVTSLRTERDMYQKMYNELLDRMLGRGAK